MLCSLVNFFTPALANIGNFELYFLNFCVLIVKKNLQFTGPFLNIYSHCVMHCVEMLCLYVSRCSYAILSTVIFLSERYGSTLYVGLARAVSPTNTNFWLTFLLTRLQEALYEDLAV